MDVKAYIGHYKRKYSDQSFMTLKQCLLSEELYYNKYRRIPNLEFIKNDNSNKIHFTSNLEYTIDVEFEIDIKNVKQNYCTWFYNTIFKDISCLNELYCSGYFRGYNIYYKPSKTNTNKIYKFMSNQFDKMQICNDIDIKPEKFQTIKINILKKLPNLYDKNNLSIEYYILDSLSKL